MKPPEMDVSEDGEFLLAQSPSGRWNWSWLRGGMQAKCRIESFYPYRTKQGALASARAAKRRLIRYCGELK